MTPSSLPQLQLELAKLLPDKLYFKFDFRTPCWKGNETMVLDTEWLYICHLIEQGMTEHEKMNYGLEIARLLGCCEPQDVEEQFFNAIYAPWPLRAQAILKVKGITI